jgi:Holin of 3TMs, for gene-transfer release
MGAIALLLPVIMPLIQSVVGGIVEDKKQAENMAAQIQLALINKQEELDKAVTESMKAQAEVNLHEAQSPSIFVAGWRPFIGWVCGVGCAYSFIVQPVVTWVSGWFGGSALPALDMAQLMPLVLGMLGLGAMRTVEKVQGVDRQSLSAASPSLAKRMFK